jgi:hypothetical protein
MFVEFQTTDSGQNSGFGLRQFSEMLDYVLTNDSTALTRAQSSGGLSFFTQWSNENPGAWVRRDGNTGAFTSSASSPLLYWSWSQPVIGKPDQAFFHKGFALRWNNSTSGYNNYFQGYMGAFQDPSSRTTFAPFDFGRPLNANYTTNVITSDAYDVLNSTNRFVWQDRYIFAAAQGYMFIGNITQGTFWAVVDGTTLPIHQYPTSASIPMLGFSGMAHLAPTTNTRHDLMVHVHKYDSGAGTTYNQLSSFTQVLNGDSTAAPNTTNFLSLYPSSLTDRGFLDRFDEDGKKSTALYPIIIGNPIRGNAYQTTEGLLLLSGQNHETGQTFYVGSARYYKFVCSHDRANRAPAFAGLVLGIPVR